MAKEFYAKVYTPQDVYITTWRDWSTQPKFRWPINGAPGGLEFAFPRRWGQSGEPNEPGPNRLYDQLDYDDAFYDSLSSVGLGDLMLDNIVRLYISDAEQSNLLIYQGRLVEYEHDILNGIVTGLLASFGVEAADRYVHDRIAVTGDPTDVALDTIVPLLPNIEPDILSPQLGTEFDFVFERQKVIQILNDLVQTAGSRWFWIINPDNTLTFSHSEFFDPIALTIGKHVAGNIKFVKSSLQRKKRVYVYGSDDPELIGGDFRVLGVSTEPGYDPDVQPLDLAVSNPRIYDNATATRIATALRRYYSLTTIETEIMIADSNFDPERGFDIESLRPGFRIQLTHPDQQFYFHKIGDHVIGDGHVIGGDWWAQVLKPFVIAEIEYNFTYAIVKLSSRPDRTIDELLTISDRLLLQETK